MGILQARILEWVSMPSSRGSSLPRGLTQISRLASGFLTYEPPGKPFYAYICVCVYIKCVYKIYISYLLYPFVHHWTFRLLPCPPGDLPNPGIEQKSPALQEDSFPSKPPGKPKNTTVGSLSLFQGDLPYPGIERWSSALQADSLPAELPGKPKS